MTTRALSATYFACKSKPNFQVVFVIATLIMSSYWWKKIIQTLIDKINIHFNDIAAAAPDFTLIVAQVSFFLPIILLTSYLTKQKRLSVSTPSIRAIIGVYLSILLISPFFSFIGKTFFLTDQYSNLVSKASQIGIGSFFAIAVIAPLAEEVLFRGILQSYLHRKVPDAVAIALSTLAFALMHGSLFQSVGVIGFGFVVSYAYYRTRNMLYPIIIHVISNSVVWWFQIRKGSINPIDSPLETPPWHTTLLNGGILFVIALVGFQLLKWSLKSYSQKLEKTQSESHGQFL